MVRFQVTLPDALHETLRQKAFEQRTTMGRLIVEILERDYGTGKAQESEQQQPAAAQKRKRK